MPYQPITRDVITPIVTPLKANGEINLANYSAIEPRRPQ